MSKQAKATNQIQLNFRSKFNINVTPNPTSERHASVEALDGLVVVVLDQVGPVGLGLSPRPRARRGQRHHLEQVAAVEAGHDRQGDGQDDRAQDKAHQPRGLRALRARQRKR